MRSTIVFALVLAACSSKEATTKPILEAPTATTPQDQAAKPPATAASADLETTLLAELATAARCSEATSPFRPWCIPAAGWATAITVPLPPNEAVLVGISIELEKGKSTAEALTTRVHFSALALKTSGGKSAGKITMITPESDAEKTMLAEAVFAVSAVLKGNAVSAAIPAELADYLKTLPAKADYPINKETSGWTWSGASLGELRRSGEFWITIEKPKDGPTGVWVSVFTDKVSSK